MRTIYISSPYSAPSTQEVRLNVHNAARLASLCLNNGFCIINPVGNAHSVARYINLPHDQWVAMDLELLSRCDCAIFARGWEKSQGCRREHAFALSKNIKVYYEEKGIPSPSP
jgi:hypothetical protein